MHFYPVKQMFSLSIINLIDTFSLPRLFNWFADRISTLKEKLKIIYMHWFEGHFKPSFQYAY